jgi:hypothetical protein
MSRNGSGVYIAPASSFPAVPATLIESAKFNTVINDLGAALTQSVSADGQTTITNNIPLNGNKITGSGAATANGDLVRYEQILSSLVMTGYAGADVTLGIGQTAIYDVTAATSIPLRIATANNQLYQLSIMPTYGASATVGVNCVLLQNNAVLGASSIVFQTNYSNNTTVIATSTTSTTYSLGFTNSLLGVEADISTKTVSKRVFSRHMARSDAAVFSGISHSINTDTTTVWSSLGTITCNAITGRIVVKRVV